MGIMSCQYNGLILKVDHEALILAIDLTERDEYTPTIYAFDTVTGEHDWFTRAEIVTMTHPVRAAYDARHKARRQEIAQLEGALRITDFTHKPGHHLPGPNLPGHDTPVAMSQPGDGDGPGPGPGQNPVAQPQQLVRPGGLGDLPDETKEIIAGITEALGDQCKVRVVELRLGGGKAKSEPEAGHSPDCRSPHHACDCGHDYDSKPKSRRKLKKPRPPDSPT